jgi:hypothetical protein
MKAAISILTVVQILSPVLAPRHDFLVVQERDKLQATATAPQCEVLGTRELTITCAYSARSSVGADRRAAPRIIILDRAVISFIPSDESHMRVELIFTKDSGSEIADPRTVYLVIDDERGGNHVRRSFPHVDFTKLEPGKPTRFEETLLVGAFFPGPYTISLWIPSTNPSWKFDSAHNFLLSSNGVPDLATGLNQIAKFSVVASSTSR